MFNQKMIYDAIIIGAGTGGMICAAKLALNGNRVLLIEKANHIGGTSYVFKRGGYAFPMGPLSYSFPQRVRDFLEEIGIKKEMGLKRNHFQLITPFLDIIYSQQFESLESELQKAFPEEKGIPVFFAELKKIIADIDDLYLWHPSYMGGGSKKRALARMDAAILKKMQRIEKYARIPSGRILEKYLKDPVLKNLLGSQGSEMPAMSLLNLAIMWNVMCFKGIWFPSWGIHGIHDAIKDVALKHGAEIMLNTPVKEICIENGSVKGVRTAIGEVYESNWVISNADYKKTFMELIHPQDIPEERFLSRIKAVPYTQSEICVYLGIDPKKVDWHRMKSTHLFYRKRLEPKEKTDFESFDDREFEICLWSDNAPGLVPPEKAALILRAGFEYTHFAHFRKGEKVRVSGYKEYKLQMADKLIKTAESILPGLRSAIDIMEVATPLTYRDWGQRYDGSIAGWTWLVKDSQEERLLLETPIENLLMVGMYAASELFLGGFATAMHTGSLASDIVLAQSDSRSR
ncbi:NAD(P)/FAD-dependent oxidoreductase [bacterium]|nr:NAD(P)/FAD-dependent oxidoreductase [bacterium]